MGGVQQQVARRSEVVDEEQAAAEVGPMPLQAGNRELLEALLQLPPERDDEEQEDGAWLSAPEYGVASMLVGLRCPPPFATSGS